ncbi:MAG: hypothetical protein J6M24_01210 [Lachnospiraceae bacterium]|nr:hypothetical protein [Lachnospiraceae bacterium]
MDDMDEYTKLVKSVSSEPKKKGKGQVKAVIAIVCAAVAGIGIYMFSSKGDGMDNPYKKKDTGFSMEFNNDKIIEASTAPEKQDTPGPGNTEEPVPPTKEPAQEPTAAPTKAAVPTKEAVNTPATKPTKAPTDEPTKAVTNTPTAVPTNVPTKAPTSAPTPRPTSTSTPKPTKTPSPRPTSTSAPKPTKTPSPRPTSTSTPKPTKTPSPRPTSTSTPRPTKTPIPTPDFNAKINVSYGDSTYSGMLVTTQGWYNGARLEIKYTNPARFPLTDWECKIVFDKPLKSASFDGGSVTLSANKKTLTLKPADWNKSFGNGNFTIATDYGNIKCTGLTFTPSY